MDTTNDNTAEQPKNKGGRPKTNATLYNRKVTFYLSDEEYDRLTAFLDLGWRSANYSSGARYLLLRSLKQWEQKGKKQIDIRRDF